MTMARRLRVSGGGGSDIGVWRAVLNRQYAYRESECPAIASVYLCFLPLHVFVLTRLRLWTVIATHRVDCP